MNEFKSIMENYFNWLKDKTTLAELDTWVVITTPHLDRNNDHIQLYARKEQNRYFLTDDGYTISDLEQSGCELNTAKRKQLLDQTLNGFGVTRVGDALQLATTLEDFPRSKHNLVQAMLAVNDMFYMAQPYVASLFHDDVVSWLDKSEIRYVERVKFTGKSGFDYVFDFTIPRSKHHPERILQTINNPNKDNAQKLFMQWFDTKHTRPAEAIAYALLNDKEQLVQMSVIKALEEYEIRPIPWSERESVKEELVA